LISARSTTNIETRWDITSWIFQSYAFLEPCPSSIFHVCIERLKGNKKLAYFHTLTFTYSILTTRPAKKFENHLVSDSDEGKLENMHTSLLVSKDSISRLE
jgi:hypothetical protein